MSSGAPTRPSTRPRRTAATRSSSAPTDAWPLAAEVDVGGEATGEGRDQLDRRLDVAEVDDLHRRVHVAERDRYEAGGDARARDLDRVGIRAGAAPAGGDRVLDAGLLGRLDEQLEDLWREGRAAADHRARAERVAADLLLVDAGCVGAVGDVNGDRQVGLQLEGRGAGAEQADLLLHRGDRGQAGAAQRALLVDAAQGLER